ncbi:MAG TPA: hypothetical protein VGE31_02025 [Candidatus Paceibacterota bacterium]
MTHIISFAEYAAHPEQIGEVLRRILDKQKVGVVWITLEEDSHWKVSYNPAEKIAECHHKGGDNFVLIAPIYNPGIDPKIDTSMKLVKLSNYEIDESGEEPDEFCLHLDKLEVFLPRILEIETALSASNEL